LTIRKLRFLQQLPDRAILNMRIRILWQGKTKDSHMRAIQEDLAARIEHFIPLSLEELPVLRGASQSRKSALTSAERLLLEKLRSATKVLMDERGRERTSQEFSDWLGKEALRGCKEMVFLIGGPDGFSAAFRDEADVLLALSRMTLTRDWARTLLIEQIYRGFTILRGYPYPR
jgi:23S rRNA (pseudouridine1915-N3)-methyltransferase